MASRKDIVELVQSLPMDDSWLPLFMERLKEKYPDIYAEVVKQARAKLEKTS